MTESNEIEQSFSEIASMISRARSNALRAVNTELINLYWQVGQYISLKIEQANWGNKIVDRLAEFIKQNQPETKGFTRRGLYRMRQFYDTYKETEFVSTLLTQISWSSHLQIMSKTKTLEEKEFYLRLAVKERWSVRELSRQIDSAYFERVLLAPANVSPALTHLIQDTDVHFKDTYIFEFLNLQEPYSENDLQKELIRNMKNFILEIGRDFSFVGEYYRVQVGAEDYYIDLLFFHRELRCLVAIELKIDSFKPEYIGKMNFYLEALDRDVKKEYENPSVGVILCKSKNAEVVEFALSRNMSPTMVSEYETKLIDKKLLEKKLHEFYELSEEKEN